MCVLRVEKNYPEGVPPSKTAVNNGDEPPTINNAMRRAKLQLSSQTTFQLCFVYKPTMQDILAEEDLGLLIVPHKVMDESPPRPPPPPPPQLPPLLHLFRDTFAFVVPFFKTYCCWEEAMMLGYYFCHLQTTSYYFPLHT